MACSSVPYSFLSSSPRTSPLPSSLVFLKFHPQTHSLKSSGPQKLKIFCCQQTLELDIESQQNTNFVKKKRKPRPSFLEQVQNKWSVKIPSSTEIFPWQKQEISDNTVQEFQSQTSLISSYVPSSDRESEKVSPPSYPRTKIKSTLPPWVHGNESREKSLNPEKSPKSQETLADTSEIEEKYDEFVETLIDQSTEIEILGGEEIENATPIVDDSPTPHRRVIRSTKPSSVDANESKRLPWLRKNADELPVNEDVLRNRNTKLAERSLPAHELKRLRNTSLRMPERMKVGEAGVTRALVDAIHEKWKQDEVVKLKFEGLPSMNMKRTHDLLESRTGGLVIWRSGSLVVLYRGMAYKLDCVKSYSDRVEVDSVELREEFTESVKSGRLNGMYDSSYFNNLSEQEQVDLHQLNRVLDELGPRFVDWSGREPVPVDADLLPAVLHGYKTPFRLLSHGTRRVLSDRDMTFLRRTARIMPPHFAIGRNRKLHGLATAMVKLWEKSAIAKIVIKRGVQITSNERMAEQLKRLTGGTLLSRNKEFIVFYRGNDFLPPNVSTTLIEKEKIATLQREEEERARQRAAALIDTKKQSEQRLVAGTLAETMDAASRWGNQLDSAEIEKMRSDTAVARHASLVNSLERKLVIAKGRMKRAEKVLRKVLENQEPEDVPTDLETLTDEERFLFRRIGLSMKPYLPLGRRGIFDGTIENMHLHWKYRELVKIIAEQKIFSQVKDIALSVEAESGGVLVSVDKTPKGYVIIVYRGKNYRAPPAVRPKNLLTKRQAMARSIELQRRESLKQHVLELEEKIERLKQEHV